METNERLQRFIACYDALRNQGRIHSKKDFAELLGVHPTTVSSAMNGSARYLTEPLTLKAESLAAGGSHSAAPSSLPGGQIVQIAADKLIEILDRITRENLNLSESVRSQQDTISVLAGSVTQRPFTKKEGAHVVGAEK